MAHKTHRRYTEIDKDTLKHKNTLKHRKYNKTREMKHDIQLIQF